MFKITCYTCGHKNVFNNHEELVCSICNTTISNQLQEETPELGVGQVVIVDNEEHPLHNNIGLICDVKHKHYRLEIQGSKIWVPEHWVKLHELDETD